MPIRPPDAPAYRQAVAVYFYRPARERDVLDAALVAEAVFLPCEQPFPILGGGVKATLDE